MSALDPITAFLGCRPVDEHLQRKRISGCRDVATMRATVFEGPIACDLCWMICDVATVNIYAPVSRDDLADIANFLRDALLLSDKAERLFGGGS